MTLTEFVNKWLGQGIDYDKKYSYQCVDVYRQYLSEALKLEQSPGVNGAADIWETYNKGDFERIANSPTAVPKQGDIVIWKRSASNGNFGHVAIVLFANINKLVVGEQDGLSNSKFRIRTADYTNALGWLRPKENVLEPELNTNKEVSRSFTLEELMLDIPTRIEEAGKFKEIPGYNRNGGIGQFYEIFKEKDEVFNDLKGQLNNMRARAELAEGILADDSKRSGWSLIAEGIKRIDWNPIATKISELVKKQDV